MIRIILAAAVICVLAAHVQIRYVFLGVPNSTSALGLLAVVVFLAVAAGTLFMARVVLRELGLTMAHPKGRHAR